MLAWRELFNASIFHINPIVESPSGAVAQLGARVNGIHEVAGSIPASSTKPHFVRAVGYVEIFRH